MVKEGSAASIISECIKIPRFLHFLFNKLVKKENWNVAQKEYLILLNFEEWKPKEELKHATLIQ